MTNICMSQMQHTQFGQLFGKILTESFKPCEWGLMTRLILHHTFSSSSHLHTASAAHTFQAVGVSHGGQTTRSHPRTNLHQTEWVLAQLVVVYTEILTIQRHIHPCLVCQCIRAVTFTFYGDIAGIWMETQETAFTRSKLPLLSFTHSEIRLLCNKNVNTFKRIQSAFVYPSKIELN